MIKDYEIKDNAVLIGGGGGASVLVPFIAKLMNLEYNIAPNAEVISSIGVATSMIREEIERTINKPDSNVISMLIDDVKSRAIAKGALPESIVVNTEYVAERGILRVIANGMAALDSSSINAREISFEEAKRIASNVMKSNDIELLLENKSYLIFKTKIIEKKFFSKKVRDIIVAIDRYGRVRLSIDNGRIIDNNIIYEVAKYLNKGDLAPQIYLIDDTKLIDFSSITSPEHVFNAIREEVKKSNGKIAAILKL
jgi:DNA polymerase III delta prime subunit